MEEEVEEEDNNVEEEGQVQETTTTPAPTTTRAATTSAARTGTFCFPFRLTGILQSANADVRLLLRQRFVEDLSLFVNPAAVSKRFRYVFEIVKKSKRSHHQKTHSLNWGSESAIACWSQTQRL